MALCPVSSSPGLVNGLVDTVDCHIRVLVQDSYLRLVGPDTPFAAAFTGLLTIYVALVGYQLLTGRGGLRVLDLPTGALKIGLILAVTTSWAAYQTLAFNLLFDGPREILATLLGPAIGDDKVFEGDIYAGLESAYAYLTHAAQTYGAQASPNANILQGGPMLGAGLLWLSAIVMLLATLGVILAAKIVLGFLLAIGPIFIGLSLFDATRALFEGWVRTAIAFALTPLAATIFAAAMLLMLSPFLEMLAANADAGQFDMGPVVAITLVVSIFTIVTVMALRLGASIASSFGLGRERRLATLDLAAARDLLSSTGVAPRERRINASPARIERDGQASQLEVRRLTGSSEAGTATVSPVSERLGQERVGQRLDESRRPRVEPMQAREGGT